MHEENIVMKLQALCHCLIEAASGQPAMSVGISRCCSDGRSGSLSLCTTAFA